MKIPATTWLENISHKPHIIAGTCTAALLATAAAAEKGQDQAKANISDTRISTAVESSLMFESSVPSHLIDITVTDGVATLEGTVKNVLAKERAIKSAQTVRGIRSVIDKITVDAPKRGNEELTSDVRDALLLDPAADSYEVTVEANNGDITLTGTVDSWQEAQLAAHVAKGVKGVKSVANKMTYGYGNDRTDAELLTEINRAMEIDVLLRPFFVDAEVNDGTVKLTGTVGSIAERKRAISAARVNGVKDVLAENLEVEAWASSDMKKKELPAIKSDEEIQKAVEDAFMYDPRVFYFNPEVSSDLGVVTLTGTVDNLKAKEAAERDARNTVGVWNVKNHLKVRMPEPIADDKIEGNINAALVWNTVTGSYEIDVEVDTGLATLSGTVDSFQEKFEAEDVAKRTNGVLLVRNNIKVEHPDLTYYSYEFDPNWGSAPYYGYNASGQTTWPTPSDAELIENIEDEFFWSPFVDEEGINITAKRGTVTLTGKVDDYSEYRSATENAYEGGAKEVYNELKFD